MKIKGYFQSEKYFLKYKDRILSLFAPNLQDLTYMRRKYRWLFDAEKHRWHTTKRLQT